MWCGEDITVFDPFNDRRSRDIRNSLSTAFVSELTGIPGLGIEKVANRWLAKVDGPAYHDYIHRRMAAYRGIIRQSSVIGFADPRGFAPLLWNAGLFFELHELLEIVWKETRDSERTAIKGLIQAAGVCVHSLRGNWRAAKGLAVRARKNISGGMLFLDFVPGLELVLRYLEDPRKPPPILPLSASESGFRGSDPNAV